MPRCGKSHALSECVTRLELGTSSNERLTGFVGRVLLEVLDEATCEILSLSFPFGSVCVSVAGIEDFGSNAREFRGDLEVEDGELLGGSGEDSTGRIPSMIPRVSLMEMRLPVPFQPVFTR